MKLQEKQKSNEMTESNVPGTEFKAMIIKMLTKLGRRMDEQSRTSIEIENIRKYQSELKTELKTILKGFNSRPDEVEE